MGRVGDALRARQRVREIREAIASLEPLLGKLSQGEGMDRAEHTLELLARLARELRIHFQEEEAEDGFFGEALIREPRLTSRAEVLCEAHPELRSEIEEIVASAGRAGVDARAWRDVAKRFSRFAKSFQAHENAENDILSDAFLEDLGGT